MNPVYDLVIIGGGPAAVAAGVYAARKKMKTVVVADSFGGQSLVSADVQNWIGTPSISGIELAQNLEKHLRAQEGIEILSDFVTGVQKTDGGFELALKSGKELQTKYVLAATGSRRRRLDVPGEKNFEGKGVAYCSICDAPLFKDKTVAVVGGGNAGLEAVIDLLPYAKKIYLLTRSTIKGDAVTLEKVRQHPNVEVMENTVVTEVKGDRFVSAAKIKNNATGVDTELPLQGVFVEIGIMPNSEFLKGLAAINERGEVTVDHRTQQTSVPGIWAAGDLTDVLYKQNNISAGDAVKAVLNIYETYVKAGHMPG